jgi:hypothetical protein
MKRIKTHWLLVVALIFSCGQGNAQSSDKMSGEVKMLKEFYTEYITKVSQLPDKSIYKKLEALKQKYCTTRFLDEMEKEESEYDRFLYAQESFAEWVKSLSIRKYSLSEYTDDNTYSVSLVNNEGLVFILLAVVEEAGGYKIDAIRGYFTDAKQLIREKELECYACYIQGGKVYLTDFNTGNTEALNLGNTKIGNIYLSPRQDYIVFLKELSKYDCNVTTSIHVYSIKDKKIENITTPDEVYQRFGKWTSDRSFSYTEVVPDPETGYKCTHTIGGETVKKEDPEFWENYEYGDIEDKFVSPDRKTTAAFVDDDPHSGIRLKHAEDGQEQIIELPFKASRYGIIAWLDSRTFLFSAEPDCQAQCCSAGLDLYLYDLDMESFSLLGQDITDFRLIKKQNTAASGIASDGDDNRLITAKGVGAFVLGKAIPASVKGYEIKKENYFAEGVEATRYEVYENGAKALKIEPKADGSIDEIMVFSGKYHTDKGLGVGSTLEDAVRAYPKYSLAYTYISERFMFNPGEYDRMQVLLDSNSFTGKQDLYGSDWVELSLKDFKSGAKVTAIRIF